MPRYKKPLVTRSEDPALIDFLPLLGSPLAMRGWTYQERILAPRTVHYASSQLIWECREELWSEGGLFRPATRYSLALELEETEQRLTGELLAELAFQLRLTRRRGIIPVYLTTVAFLLALAISSTAPSGGSGVDPLLPGLLFTWGPVLILLTLVDRNPISSDRHRELFERWLHNVSAIHDWRIMGQMRTVISIQWWREPARLDERRDFMYSGEFIGQGRTVGDAGLAAAVMLKFELGV